MAEELKCQATTSEGEQCNNPAKYPKDNPIACHLKAHQKQLGVTVKKEDIDETKTHIFGSDKLVHIIFVNYPEDDDRDFFRADFSGGKWETDDDEKAKLLEEYNENHNHINLEKVQ